MAANVSSDGGFVSSDGSEAYHLMVADQSFSAGGSMRRPSMRKLAVLFQVFKGRPSASDQKAAIGVPTAGEGQGYRVIVSQRFVGIKPSPTHPTPAFWRMCPSRLVPEERKAQRRAR